MPNPTQIDGAWRLGWALDVHTTSSVFLGYDSNGHAQFDTTRSPLGELMYQLKYCGQSKAANEIAAVMAAFLSKMPVVSRIDLIIPMPASTQRSVQPVDLIATALATSLKKTYANAAVSKTRQTPTLKNVYDPEQRRELLDGAFEADKKLIDGKGVLLVDDLYRSGSTANAVTLALIAAGASRVYFLAATRTRSNT